MNTVLTHAIGIGLLAAVGAATLALVGPAPGQQEAAQGAAPEAARPVPVEAAPLTFEREVRLPHLFTGELVARRVTTLAFELAGSVVFVAVDEGHAVRAGDVLARLDPARLEARRAELMAERAAAAATLDELVAGPRTETVDAARAELAARDAELALVDSRLARRRGLSGGAVAEETVRDLESERAVVAARRAASAAVLAELERGTRVERLAAQRATLDRIDAALATLALDIADTALVAPFDGVIARRFVDEGALVAAGTPALELSEAAHVEARVGLTAAAAAAVLADPSAARASVDGAPLAVAAARLLPELERATRTRTVVLELVAAGGGDSPTLASEATLVPGETVTVEVDLVLPAEGAWVPLTALSEGTRGLWSLFTVTESAADPAPRVTRADVEVLHTLGDRAFVRGSFGPGDRVVSSGTHRLAPGQRVTLIATPTEGTPR